MDLRQLKALLAVADTGSVTRAAERLLIVQPAVTRQIRLLEEEMGSSLFVRGRHGMEPTTEGEILIVAARRAVDEIERGRSEVQGAIADPTGVVSVALLASTADVIAPSLVMRLRERAPGLVPRILVGFGGEVRSWLTEGEADVGLLYVLRGDDAVMGTTLLREGLWAVAPTAAGLPPSAPVDFATVAVEPFILPAVPHGLRGLIQGAEARTGHRVTVVAETNSVAVQKQLVLDGVGWTILPGMAVARDVASGTLSGGPVRNPTITRSVAVVASDSGRPPPGAAVATEVLVDTVRSAVGSGAWPTATWVGPLSG